MAKLAGLRFVSLGVKEARMPDLYLNFCDRNGRATDSTLWLRNGGGKSSILNLFFALVRPDRREFLGSKAEGKIRLLEHYVLENDHGVMAAEWELEGSERLITGVFYERGQEKDLRRYFFSARSSRALSIHTLPIMMEGSDGQKKRRTLAGFRAEWQALRQKFPEQQISWSDDNLTQWKEILSSAGIDHELFSYQVKMNEREGGADSLFRFKTAQAFIDFLFELALEPGSGEKIRNNVNTFRQELVGRKNEHKPKRELYEGLVGRFKVLAKIAQARADLDRHCATLTGRKNGLKGFLSAELARIQGEMTFLKGQVEKEKETVGQSDRQVIELRIRAAALRRHVRRLAAQEARKKEAFLKNRQERAETQKDLLDAARVLFQALRYEGMAKGVLSEMDRLLAEHRPLLRDLKQAAEKYGGAILDQKSKLEEKLSSAMNRQEKERKSAEVNQKQESGLNHQLGRIKADLENLEKEIHATQQTRAKLELEGILGPEESALEAEARLEAARAGHETAVVRAGDEAKEISREIESLWEKLREAGSQEAAVRIEEREARRIFNADCEEKISLEARPALRKHLELESVDLDRLDELLLQRLDQVRRSLAERIAVLSTEISESKRAIISLENGGLLPPSPDVERVLDVLKDTKAWSGWSALEANLPKEARRPFIGKRPDVVEGIIVRDGQLEAALERIHSEGLVPERPVVISPLSAFQNGQPAHEGVVLGPASDAFFDKEAGGRELARRHGKLATLQSTQAARIADLEDLTTALSQVRQFRKTHPVGWMKAESIRLENLKREADQLKMAQDSLRQLGEKRKADLRDKETAGRVAKEASYRAGIQKARVRDFHDRFEANSRDRERKHRELMGKEADTVARKEKFAQEVLGNLRAAEEAEREKGEASLRLDRLKNELSQVKYLPEKLAAVPGPIDILREKYDLLRSEYEGKLGREGLQQRYEEHQKSARDCRDRFVHSGQKEEKVLEAMAGINDPNELDDAYQLAQKAFNSAWSETTQYKKEVIEAVGKLEEIEKHCAALEEVPELSEIPDDAEAEAIRCDEEGELKRALGEAAEKRGQEATLKTKDLETAATGRVNQQQQLVTLESSNTDLFLDSPLSEDVSSILLSVNEFLHNMTTDLKMVRESRGSLNQQREKEVSGMRRWRGGEQFKMLYGTLADNLLLMEEHSLEAQAEHFTSQLELTVKTIDDQLAKINEHRNLLLNFLQSEVEEALKLLRAAANSSCLPQTIPGLAGKQFLRIHLNPPSDPAEIRAKLSDLLDSIIDRKEIPSGLELIQQAVHRVTGQIGVRILHPDPNSLRETVEITEMGLSSGGEQLTGAIMLYCALAQLRLKRRGTQKRPSSVLILDNPIGKSSRVSFLDLQREVARSMGIQLLYTTAVNDLDALATLPNVIRLRNDRQDRNTQERVVEPEITQARIVRPERSNAPSP